MSIDRSVSNISTNVSFPSFLKFTVREFTALLEFLDPPGSSTTTWFLSKTKVLLFPSLYLFTPARIFPSSHSHTFQKQTNLNSCELDIPFIYILSVQNPATFLGKGGKSKGWYSRLKWTKTVKDSGQGEGRYSPRDLGIYIIF